MLKRSLIATALLAMATWVPLAVAQDSDSTKAADESSADAQAKSNQDASQSTSDANANDSANSSDQSQSKQGETGAPLDDAAGAKDATGTSESDSQSGSSSGSRDSNTNSGQATNDNGNSRDSASTQGSQRDDSARGSNDQQDRSVLSGNRSNDRNDRDGGRNQQRDFRSDFKFGRATDRGLTISSVTQGSIFYRSGLRNGDVIISYNGRPIRSESDFTRVVVYQPGQRVPVVVLRDGREETIYVVYEEDVAQTQSVGRVYFGAEFDPQSRDAAVVVRVDEGSPAAEAGLQRDDIVLAMNGDEVRNGQDAMLVINSLNEGDRVEIEFSRNVRTEAVLTGSHSGRAARTTDTRVDQANHEAGVAGGVGVGVDQTRRSGEGSNSEYNSRDRENRDSDRSNSRENRRILPRLRN